MVIHYRRISSLNNIVSIVNMRYDVQLIKFRLDKIKYKSAKTHMTQKTNISIQDFFIVDRNFNKVVENSLF